MKIISLLMVILIVTISGCARNMYDGFRFRQEMDCQKLQGADRDECSRRSSMSYDEYQQQLKEREKDK